MTRLFLGLFLSFLVTVNSFASPFYLHLEMTVPPLFVVNYTTHLLKKSVSSEASPQRESLQHLKAALNKGAKFSFKIEENCELQNYFKVEFINKSNFKEMVITPTLLKIRIYREASSSHPSPVTITYIYYIEDPTDLYTQLPYNPLIIQSSSIRIDGISSTPRLISSNDPNTAPLKNFFFIFLKGFLMQYQTHIDVLAKI